MNSKISNYIATKDPAAAAIIQVSDARQAARLARGRAPITMQTNQPLDTFMQSVRTQILKIYGKGVYEVKDAKGKGLFMIVKAAR